MEIRRDGTDVYVLPDTAKCCADEQERNPIDMPLCPERELFCSGECPYYTE